MLILSILIFFFLNFISSNKIEVHIIPHTHIDQGWINTIEGYRGSVEQILNSVLSQLRKNSDYVFNWAEVYYFKQWYEGHKEKSFIKHLVESGRFHFLGGGLVQNDESCPSYTSIVEQMSYGLQFLKKEFGVTPKTAWQIDPFGHDTRMVPILAEMGFENLIINRVHYNIKRGMKDNRNLEFFWEVGDYSLFTHTLWKHYASPEGFDFEGYGRIRDVGSSARRFENYLGSISKNFKFPVLSFPIGDDFKFKHAESQYSNWDKLIEHFNSDPNSKYTLKYSTMDKYIKKLKKYLLSHPEEKVPVLRQDFFTYQDHYDAWWSGYYTTWPGLKRDIRQAEEELAHAQFLESTLEFYENKEFNSVDTIKKIEKSAVEVYVATHHDYITGTSPRRSIDDYYNRMARSITGSNEVSKEMMQKIFEKSELHNMDKYLEINQKYSIHVSNPSSDRWERIQFTSKSNNFHITYNGARIEYQVIPRIISEFGKSLGDDLYDIHILLFVPGMSVSQVLVDVLEPKEKNNHATYYFYSTDEHKVNVNDVHVLTDFDEETLRLGNNKYVFTFNKKGYINSVYCKENSRLHSFKEMFVEYETHRGGAYIFRPNGKAKPLDNKLKNIYLIKGRIFDSAYIETEKVKYKLFVYKNEYMLQGDTEIVEFEYRTSPIRGNTNLVLQLSTDNENLSSGKSTLITSNGINFVPRSLKEFGEFQIAARYYPASHGAIFRNFNGEINVHTRNVHGVSAVDDSLQIIIHRNLRQDDGRGMGQANNDNKPGFGKMLFSFYAIPNYEINDYEKFDKISGIYNRPLKTFISERNDNDIHSEKSVQVLRDLPENLEVVSFKRGIFKKYLVAKVRNLDFNDYISFDVPKSLNYANSQFMQVNLNELNKIPQTRKNSWSYFKESIKGNEKYIDPSNGRIYDLNNANEGDFFGIPLFNDIFIGSKPKTTNNKIYLKPRQMIAFKINLNNGGIYDHSIDFEDNTKPNVDNNNINNLDEEEDEEEEFEFEEFFEELLVDDDEWDGESEEEYEIKPKLRELIPEMEGTGVLKPRHTIIVYSVFFFLTIFILFFLFTTNRGKKNYTRKVKDDAPFKSLV